MKPKHATKNGMVETQCPNCGKTQYTYIRGMRGEIPAVFCDKVCETEYKNPSLVRKYGRKSDR